MSAIKQEVYTKEGKKKGTMDLPGDVFSTEVNDTSLKQVILSLMSNQRQASAKTKDRSEVSGGGIKPWRQKGTGRARHGSIRSPIWVGGGRTFGPTGEKDYSKKINKKLLKKTLNAELTKKLKEKRVFFVENFKLEKASTKEMSKLVEHFQKDMDVKETTKNKCLIVLERKRENENIFLSARNIKGVSILPFSQLNALDVMKYKFVIFIGEISFDKLEK